MKVKWLELSSFNSDFISETLSSHSLSVPPWWVQARTSFISLFICAWFSGQQRLMLVVLSQSPAFRRMQSRIRSLSDNLDFIIIVLSQSTLLCKITFFTRHLLLSVVFISPSRCIFTTGCKSPVMRCPGLPWSPLVTRHKLVVSPDQAPQSGCVRQSNHHMASWGWVPPGENGSGRVFTR